MLRGSQASVGESGLCGAPERLAIGRLKRPRQQWQLIDETSQAD
jgi:hypothetical protein